MKKKETDPTFIDLGELMRRKPLVLVERKRGYINVRFRPSSNEYGIENHRINTPEKLLGWIHHLCGKGQVTTEHIRQLIDVAHKNGVNIDYRC